MHACGQFPRATHMSGTSMINIAASRWLTMHLVDRNAMWCVRCADAASGLHCTTARAPIPIAARDAIVPRDPRTVGQNNNFVLTVDEICCLWKDSVAEDSFYCVDQDVSHAVSEVVWKVITFGYWKQRVWLQSFVDACQRAWPCFASDVSALRSRSLPNCCCEHL